MESNHKSWQDRISGSVER